MPKFDSPNGFTKTIDMAAQYRVGKHIIIIDDTLRGVVYNGVLVLGVVKILMWCVYVRVIIAFVTRRNGMRPNLSVYGVRECYNDDGN